MYKQFNWNWLNEVKLINELIVVKMKLLRDEWIRERESHKWKSIDIDNKSIDNFDYELNVIRYY